MTRFVHHIHSDCDLEISKTGPSVRFRIREKDPDLILPTDIEFEGDGDALYALFKNVADTLEHFRNLEDKKAS